MRCGAYMRAGISSRPVALDGLRFVKSLKTFSVPFDVTCISDLDDSCLKECRVFVHRNFLV